MTDKPFPLQRGEEEAEGESENSTARTPAFSPQVREMIDVR
jgi:hypothetical protein